MMQNYNAGSAATEKSEQDLPRSKQVVREIGRVLFLLFCGFLTAVLLYLSFTSPGYSWLGWLAFFPFTLGITRVRRFWTSTFYGWFTGFLFHAFSLYWIYYTCLHGGELSVGLSAAAWLGLSGLLALQMALFGGSCYYLKKTGPFFPILAACGWVTFEWLHQVIAFYGIGFPWFMVGGTQWNFPQMLQLASLTGVYGLSFCLVWVGTLLGWALTNPSVKKIGGNLLLAALITSGVYGFGYYRLKNFERMQKRQPLLSVQAALMQPNIDQYKKWDENYEQEIMDTLAEMGQQLEAGKTMLTIWPESVTPGPLSDEKYAAFFENMAADSKSYQLVGSFIPGKQEQYVGAFLLAPGSGQWQEYHKIKLVPFGEFVPFASKLESLFPNLTILGELGAFTPGARNQKILNLTGVPLGSTICYESIFPQLWLSQTRRGAKLFVNITNDAWFFSTAAPYQHLAANVIRAVETGRPVLRAANTGFSAVINPVGRLEQRSGLFTRTMLQTSVALLVGEYNTFYTQWGDWFAWLCAAVFFTLLISTMVFAYE